MTGPDLEDDDRSGMIPRMVRAIFDRIINSSEDNEFTVKLSMVEIYMERLRDLLDPSKINL
jgi:kinesin family protein 5